MAITVSLTDGVTTIPLVYNQVNQFAFKATYGTSLDPGEPVPVWHAPEGYPPELIDLYDPNRQMILGFELISATASSPIDDVNNALATLRRWVDGAHQQAARFWIHGDVNRVDLIIQRDNSTVATYHPVVFGTVDDGQGHYSAVAQLNDMVYDAVIRLTLKPYGESGSDIELFNVLLGAAFDFESGTAGLADGWNSTGATTNTLDTAVYLVNGMSQKCDADIDGGVQSDTVAATATTGAGYVWVYVTSGSVKIELYDSTAAAVRDTATLDATDSNGVSDKTTEDIAGNTWWRVPLSSSSLTNTNNHRIRVRATITTAVFHVDVAYLRFGIFSPPDAWCSYCYLNNRGDQSTTNPEYINWVDVWGIPGDVDALVRHTITANSITGASGEEFSLSAFKDKSAALAADYDHWVEGEAMTNGAVTNGSWADTAVAGTSAGTVNRFTATSTGATAIVAHEFPYLACPTSVYVRAAASVGTISLAMQATGSAPSPIISTPGSVTLDSTFSMYYMGLVQIESPINSGVTEGNLAFYLSGFTANGQTADIDCVLTVPVIDGRVYINTGAPNLGGDLGDGVMVIDGINEDAYRTWRIDAIGIYPTATAGGHVTRFYYHRLNETVGGGNHLTDTYTVALSIVPRTKHLLGTV